ncbi:hypothetical protein BOQ62_09870 [Chryseobacterium sp. CH21]|uniref:zinc-dependent metalloprotease n=1 Tax=Chryseobacterium sp. CH21 TaxID=713556 RepID=UPI00100B266D|nr:zinc-dependent metalloprotease [Chryseobacterium sp. CH21]RXM39724.1 hypothetical protein BOQ62_09870 [Chryseobacterium sp. CH21]
MKKSLLLTTIFLFGLCFSQVFNNQELPGRIINIDISTLQRNVQRLQKNTSKIRNQSLVVEMPDGNKQQFILNENNVSGERLKEITTFDGVSKDNKYKMKLSLYDNYINAMMSTQDGYYIIEPSNKAKSEYRISPSSERNSNFECKVIESLEEKTPGITTQKSFANFPIGSQLRSYRMAVATTGEFTQAYGTQDLALAEAVNMVNLITLIYENELAVTFTLISQTTNKSLIFTDPATDPFNGSVAATAGAAQTGFNTLNNNGSLLYNAYDVGHMFGLQASGASGTAGGTPCNNSSKASGGSSWAYDPNPNASKGWIANLIAHEIGHQFGASHTYNGTGGSTGSPTFCTDNWSGSGAVEPGGGISIMAYPGNCSIPNQVNTPSILGFRLFHAKSIDQMLTKINNISTCNSSINTTNIPPTANAGLDISIPKNTPFKLKGIASDPNDTDLIYNWDQMDIATANDKGAMGYNLAGVGGYTAVNGTTTPLFRTEPLKTPERYFPKMEYVINNDNTPPDLAAEALSQVARNIRMRFTVRDNNAQAGGVDSDEMIITVTNDGPLKVTYPDISGISISANSNMNVTWDVNNTNSLKNTVNILLSIDGGSTYPIILAADTPNSGSKSVTMPNVPATANARIKVVAVLNTMAEFFDISNNNFTITSTCEAYPSYAYPTNSVTAIAGSLQANLNMSAPMAANPEVTGFQNTYGTGLTSNNLIVYENSSQLNPYFQDVRQGMVTKFKVTESGNYVFTKTSGYMIMSIASGTPFTTANFVTSSGFFNGTGISVYSSTKSVYLSAGTDYYLLLASASSGATHTITVNGPGKMFTESTPPAGYSYTFAAIDSNDKIAALSPNANFTTLPSGSYTVQGLSYTSSANLSTFINSSISDMIVAGVCLNIAKNNRSLIITGSLAVSENIMEEEIKIFPNPVGDELHIISKDKVAVYSITDFSGRLIRKENMTGTKVNVSDLSPGNYVIQFYDNTKLMYQTKFIKK